MDESMDQGNQGEAFEHSRVLLFSFASRMTGSASEAEDLVQETRCMRRTGNAQPSQEAPPKQGNWHHLGESPSLSTDFAHPSLFREKTALIK